MNGLECAGIYLPAHSWNKGFFFLLTNKTEINSEQMMMRGGKYCKEEETGSWMRSMSLVRVGKGNSA